MIQVFGIFAVWLVVVVAENWVEAPKWMWYLFMASVGIGWQLLADDASRWWLGAGIGAAAAVLSLVTDLILVATDAVKVSVLRRSK